MATGMTEAIAGLDLGPVEEHRHKLILGVDYGTTYTGVSHVSSVGGVRNVEVIKTWPGDNQGNWKTPSCLAYPDETRAGSRNMKWGFDVPPDKISYSWTKLLLDSSAESTTHDDPALMEKLLGRGWMQLPPNKTAQDVCRDYLSQVYQYAIFKLEELNPGALDLTPMEFWITVPAIWSDTAKAATRNAALEAGFGSRPGDHLFMITEPEAAALASLVEEVDSHSKPIQAGENVLICDCGGGTVDITTYQISSTHPLKFKEILPGDGGKCGSTYIDRNFYSWMQDKFGEAFTALPPKRTAPGSSFMRSFERIKHGFGYQGDDYYTIGLMMEAEESQYYDPSEYEIVISHQDMEDLFSPAVIETINLVTRQQKALQAKGEPLDRIVLVGGFGDSPYLKRILRTWCEANGNVKLITPQACQAAVVKGAALRGLLGQGSDSTQCRRYYGFSAAHSFRPGLDDESSSYVCPFTKRKLCSGKMDWMVHKGETITSQATKSLKLHINTPDLKTLIYKVSLYSSEANYTPEAVGDETVKDIAMIEVDFRSANLKKFERFSKTIGNFFTMEFELRVDYGSKDGVLVCSSWVQDQEVGTASVTYSNQ